MILRERLSSMDRGRRMVLAFVLLLIICPVICPGVGTDTLFLTWFDDPSTTMVVQWLERGAWLGKKAPDPGEVFCAEKHEETFRAVPATVRRFGSSRLFVQQVRLDGLTPDTTYVFSVGGDRVRRRFRTAPATLEKPLVFAEGGDIGTAPVVADLHDRAASWDPLFGLVGGDLAYGNGVDSGAWVKYLQLWHRHMVGADGRLIPMVVAIGNHETDNDAGEGEEPAPFFRALFGGLYSDGSYKVLDFGDYLSLLLLDSGHMAPVAGAQTEWLRDALRARKERAHVFPVYHVPAYPSHRLYDAPVSRAIREHWIPLFEASPVRVAFEHHDHTYKRTHPLRQGKPSPDGIVYLGDGAWGKAPRVISDRERKTYLKKASQDYNVIRVTLLGDHQAFLMVDEKGDVLDRYPESE